VNVQGGGNSQYDLRRNQIVSNTANSKGGVWITGLDPTLVITSQNNLIALNQGSGLYLQDANFRSTNDTFADNGTYGLVMTGTFGITTTARLTNTIIWGHTGSFTSTQAPTYTLVATFSDIQGGWAGIGNIDANPLFVGGGDYRLQETSLAKDTADPAYVPQTDLAGIPRPVPVGGRGDMGCYEWFRAGVTLAPDRASTEPPGAAVTFQHTLTNAGNLSDTFLLDVALNSLGWPVTVTPASVALNAGATASVQVTVAVPAGTTGGALDEVTVRARSQSDGAVMGIVVDRVTAANVAGVLLTPDRASTVTPGTVVRYEHTLTNTGNFTDTISLAASSSQRWTVVVMPAAAIVPKDSSTTVIVSVTMPSGTLAGVMDTTTITATSSITNGAMMDSVTDASTAIQVAGVDITPGTSKAAAPGSDVVYTHTVTNLGNGTDTYGITAASSRGWTTTVSPANVTLNAGASASIQVTVPAGAGGQTDVMTVTVTSSYNNAVSDRAWDTTQVWFKVYLPTVIRN